MFSLFDAIFVVNKHTYKHKTDLRNASEVGICEPVLIARPFVKRFILCHRTVVCLVLSVALVYCGQTVGWIKMPLGMEVGLGPGHIVLDGDPANLRFRGVP